MNKNFTHKILPILSIFLFVVFTLCTSCFAMDINYNDKTITLPDLPDSNPYYIIWKSSTMYRLITSSEPIKIMPDSDYPNGEYVYIVYVGSAYNCSGDLSSWSLWTSSGKMQDRGNSLFGNCVVLLNHDILDNEGNVVFQAPVEEVEKQTILAPVIQEQETTMKEKPLGEILTILPIVIIIIVSLIGLRKALNLLRTLLKSA